jgi:hypothetical protein
MRRFAVASPRSIAFASMTSSAAVSSLWRPTSARKSWRLSAAPSRRPRRRPAGLLLALLLGLGAGGDPSPIRSARPSLSTSVSSRSSLSATPELGWLVAAPCALDHHRLGLIRFEQL